MLSKSANRWRVFAIVVCVVAAPLIWRNFHYYQKKAVDSAAKGEAQAVRSAEESYFYVYQEYTDDLSKAGFFPMGNGPLRIYTTPGDVPQDISQQLKDDEKPFASKSSFRFVLVFKESESERSVWLVEPNGQRSLTPE